MIPIERGGRGGRTRTIGTDPDPAPANSIVAAPVAPDAAAATERKQGDGRTGLHPRVGRECLHEVRAEMGGIHCYLSSSSSSSSSPACISPPSSLLKSDSPV
jgi:hypothetical protein